MWQTIELIHLICFVLIFYTDIKFSQPKRMRRMASLNSIHFWSEKMTIQHRKYSNNLLDNTFDDFIWFSVGHVIWFILSILVTTRHWPICSKHHLELEFWLCQSHSRAPDCCLVYLQLLLLPSFAHIAVTFWCVVHWSIHWNSDCWTNFAHWN